MLQNTTNAYYASELAVYYDCITPKINNKAYDK